MNQEDKPRSRWIWAVPFGLILVATGGAIEWARQQEIAYHRLIAVLPMILQAVQSGRQAPVWWAMAAQSLGFTSRVSPAVVIETLWRRLEHLKWVTE
ncbi:histidine kinase, partial [Methylacidiphilum kamchatkense Kam1]